MELIEAYRIIDKYLEPRIQPLGFSKVKSEDEAAVHYKSEKGLFRFKYEKESNILLLECAYEDKGESTEYETISKSLFTLADADERDCRSAANEFAYELEPLFKTNKKKDLDKIKMPKAVSRSKAKNGVISYDVDSLANRFGTLYPEYGEFLPETFFEEVGTQKVLDVIKNGTEQERKKLFKMLGDVYEDGTNEVQDVIGVTILGEMKNDPDMMAVADKYMTEYMAGPVHEINKIMAKSNRLTKKLANPPAYKPKKKKNAGILQNALNQQR